MLETDRLKLIPLSKHQLERYLLCDGTLEEELNLALVERTINPRVYAAIRTRILPKMRDHSEVDFRYYTFWLSVFKPKNAIAAEIGFKGPPNERGEVEIGFATHDEFRNQNVMTETLNALCQWAFEQPDITAVVGVSDPQNTASHRVLEKNNFTPVKETTTDVYWRLASSRLHS